jgi:hypothetical protein
MHAVKVCVGSSSDRATKRTVDSPDDRSEARDRQLEWKVWIFCISAVVGLCGIYFEERWMTGSAIALLLGAMGLRLLPGLGARGGDEE